MNNTKFQKTANIPKTMPASALSSVQSGESHGASSVPTAAHPPISQMVNMAIKNLHVKDCNKDSFSAIKVYINANYKTNADNFSPHIQRHLKSIDFGKGTKDSGSVGLGKIGQHNMTSANLKTSQKIRVATPHIVNKASSNVSFTRVSASKVSASKVSASKVSASKVSASKVSASKVSASKVSASRVSASKVSASKVSASKVSALRVPASRVFTAKATHSGKTCGKMQPAIRSAKK